MPCICEIYDKYFIINFYKRRCSVENKRFIAVILSTMLMFLFLSAEPGLVPKKNVKAVTRLLGLKFPDNQKIQLAVPVNVTVDKADKLNEFINDPRFISEKGDPATIVYKSRVRFSLEFPKQLTIVKLHLEKIDGRFRAITDWLGSLKGRK